MHVVLCDRDPVVVSHWNDRLGGTPGLTVAVGDIFSRHVDAVVVPAEGISRRGLAGQAVARLGGMSLLAGFRRRCVQLHGGERVPVGACLPVPIRAHQGRIRWLLWAPTAQVAGWDEVSRTERPGQFGSNPALYWESRPQGYAFVGGGMQAEEPVYRATRAALERAAALGIERLAMPGMGAGLAGLAVGRVVDEMSRALEDAGIGAPDRSGRSSL